MPMKTKEEQREYQRLWRKRRRLDWIESQGGCCVKCGSTDDLEIDHIDRKTKSMNPSSIWSRNSLVREKELAKCQVLCASHHLEKTLSEIEIPLHGTESRYTHKKNRCRCDECREAARVAKASWRLRTGKS